MRSILILLPILIIGCSSIDEDTPSTYPQLNGVFAYYNYDSWNGGLYEDYDYVSYHFDDTIQAWKYSKHWSYTSSGWVNAAKEAHSYYIEWKVENGQFKSILWDNQFDSWQSLSFEFIDNNNVKIGGLLYTKD